MGNTPSTLNLTAGKHDIVVKKTGYDDWTRSMTVGEWVEFGNGGEVWS
jgi:hypothetical protein